MSQKFITKIYTKNFNKSKVFLYPILGLKQNALHNPINTYMFLNENALNQCKLYVVYSKSSKYSFIEYEQTKIHTNEYFEDFINGENNIIYIFNLKKHEEDYFHIINSSFSKLSSDTKKKIETYFGLNSANYNYIKTWLYPNKYYRIYARILAEENDFENMIDLLKNVCELCSKTNLKNETLINEYCDLII